MPFNRSLRVLAPRVVLLLCSGCMVLSHDAYFSPGSTDPHEPRSPFPGNPWNTFTAFGAPADIITLRVDGARIGLSVRNSASSFAWIGPVFVPLIPFPVRGTLETTDLRIWLGITSERGVVLHPDRFRLRLPGGAEALAPVATERGPLEEPLRAGSGTRGVRVLRFAVPEARDLHSFDLEVRGMETGGGPVEPVVVHYSRVRGWRVTSLP